MKEIMKQTKKTETKRHLTDAELQQATGALSGGDGMPTHIKEKSECSAQSDKASCENISYCAWWKGKDSYYCRYYQN